MTTNTEIEEMIATSRHAYESAQTVIDAMHDGERIQIKDLAKTVGLALAMDPKEVLGFVSFFAHKTTSAYVTRGKNGGIIKGTRPVKVVKVKKPKKAVTEYVSLVDATDSPTV
jgi:hypothetical protein